MRADAPDLLALWLSGAALGAAAWTLIDPWAPAVIGGVGLLLIVVAQLRSIVIERRDRRTAYQRWQAWG